MAKVADLALPKSGYVWAILWYPGGRKEFVEIEPEKVHSLDESYSRLKSNRKPYVALANAAAVARMGW